MSVVLDLSGFYALPLDEVIRKARELAERLAEEKRVEGR